MAETTSRVRPSPPPPGLAADGLRGPHSIGSQAMIDLLADPTTAIFTPLRAGKRNYIQVAGVPMYTLKPLPVAGAANAVRSSVVKQVGISGGADQSGGAASGAGVLVPGQGAAGDCVQRVTRGRKRKRGVGMSPGEAKSRQEPPSGPPKRSSIFRGGEGTSKRIG